MALGIKYRAEFKDIKHTKTCRLDVLIEGYASSVQSITKAPFDPVYLDYGHKSEFIKASDIQFNFWVFTSDAHKYDDIFTQNYKDAKINYYIDSVLEWSGWVTPSTFSRPYNVEGQYILTITATDGLADLKNVPFQSSSTTLYDDKVSLMTVIKRCLSGIGIDLDFKIQCNIYALTYMTSSELVFDKAEVQSKLWTDVSDGGDQPDKCYEVLESIFEYFDCEIMQADGYYWINQKAEYNSYYYPVTWSSLAVGTRTASNISLSLSSYDLLSDGVLKMIEPVKYYSVYERQRASDNQPITGSTWTNGPSPYDFSSFTSASVVICGEDDTGGPETLTQEKYFESEEFYFAETSTSDTIDIHAEILLSDVGFDTGSTNPQARIELVTPSSTRLGTYTTLTSSYIDFDESLDADGAGLYKVRIRIKPETSVDYSYWTVYTREVSAEFNYVNQEYISDWLRVYECTDHNFSKSDEVNLRIEGAGSSMSSLYVDFDVILGWYLYGSGFSDGTIVPAALYNKANTTTKYIQGLIVSDYNNNIKPYTFIIIGTEYYKIKSYKRNFKENRLELDLHQILFNTATYTQTDIKKLTTIEGG